MSDYLIGESADLYDQLTGKWLGVLDSKGRETLVPSGGALTPVSNTLALIGDSITSSYFQGTVASPSTVARGFIAWALVLSGQRMSIVSNSAVANSGVSGAFGGVSLETQLTAAIASGANHLFMMGGINDVNNSATTASIKAAWLRIINKAIAAGMRIWWGTTPYQNAAAGGYTVARQGQIMHVNDWSKQLAYSINQSAGRNYITVVDINGAAVNPASATGDYLTNGSFDNLHPRNLAAYRMGKELARVWSLWVPESPKLLTSNVDTYTYSPNSTNIVPNGLFVNGTPTATGFTAGVTGGATQTPSIVARADGFGNDQQQVITFAADGDSSTLTTGNSLYNYLSDGDVIVAQCEVTLSAITNCKNLQLTCTLFGGTIQKTAKCLGLESYDQAFTEGWTGVLQTLPMNVDIAAMGALFNCGITLACYGSGVGGATLKTGRMSIRKIVG